VTPFELPVPARLSRMGIAIWDEQLDRKRPRLGAGGLDRGRPATALRMGASRADQPQVKIGLGGRATRAIRCPPLLARRRHCRLSVWTLNQFECGNVGAFRPRLQYSPADFTGYVAAMRH